MQEHASMQDAMLRLMELEGFVVTRLDLHNI